MDDNTLTFVGWYTRKAVYLGDDLVFFGEHRGGWQLVAALGYQCRALDEVPDNRIPPEFDRGELGWWKPPQSLAELERQFAAWRARQKAERVDSLKAELAALLGEDG
jgi:hypothetical protein